MYEESSSESYSCDREPANLVVRDAEKEEGSYQSYSPTQLTSFLAPEWRASRTGENGGLAYSAPVEPNVPRISTVQSISYRPILTDAGTPFVKQCENLFADSLSYGASSSSNTPCRTDSLSLFSNLPSSPPRLASSLSPSSSSLLSS